MKARLELLGKEIAELKEFWANMKNTLDSIEMRLNELDQTVEE